MASSELIPYIGMANWFTVVRRRWRFSTDNGNEKINFDSNGPKFDIK